MQEVQHDEDQHKFFVSLGKDEAYLKYKVLPSGDLDFYSTFVPDSGRGMGLAAKLVLTGFEFAKSNHQKVKPTCSYVAAFFEKNNEWKDLKII